MNKRIKELANKAGYSKDYLEIGLPSNMEKFAELIVKECCDVAHRNHYVNRLTLGDKINKHFRVEL